MNNNSIIDYLLDNDEIFIFNEMWLYEADAEFKILLLVSILAENNLAFRGNLKSMTDWLCIKPTSINNKSIKSAIENLEDKGLINVIKDGRTYTISITEYAFKYKFVNKNNLLVKLRKQWIEVLKTYNKDKDNKTIDKKNSIDYIKIVKVFIYVYSHTNQEYFTQRQIAKELDISAETVRKALKAITETKFNQLEISKKVLKERIDNNLDNRIQWLSLGTQINIFIPFD